MNVSISTNTDPILSSDSEKLLGAIVHEHLKWAEYVMHGKGSLISQLNSRLSALKIISKYSSFNVRLMISNGIFISKLIYLIQLWSGCEQYLIKALQIVQNKAARVVTNSDRYTSIKKLLQQCGWLSVSQLAAYHSLCLMYTTLKTECPKYLHQKILTQLPYTYPCAYRTRLAESNNMIVEVPQLIQD